MSHYESYILKQAAETIGKLRELMHTGPITMESSVAIGEASAMLKILSNALEARSERAV
jgi:hypothetical protein